MSSPAEILPNIEIIYTSAACDACDKYDVCRSDLGFDERKKHGKQQRRQTHHGLQ